MKLIAFITKALAWLQIVASPLLAGIMIGFIIFLAKPDTIGIILAVFITLTGLIAGIIWANRIWKKEGTVSFTSRIIATPELDKKDE